MKYEVHFYFENAFADEHIEAHTPEEALFKAQVLWASDEGRDDLISNAANYDEVGPLNSININGAEAWIEPSYLAACHATALLEAGEAFLEWYDVTPCRPSGDEPEGVKAMRNILNKIRGTK